jgi:S1-C subfamily serine protease
MDEVLLLEAVERYLKGEMPAQEKIFFEELRKTKPEVDQLVVEHTFLFHELDRHADIKAYKHSLYEVETKLTEEGIISKQQLQGKAKIVFLWKKYKRNIAVAASIAGIMSITTAGLIIAYTQKVNESNKEDLIGKWKNTNTKIDKLNDKLQTSTTATPAFTSTPDYRATGFLIDGKGYLVTNAHVVNRLKTPFYVVNNKGDYFNAETVYTDNNSDLAILKINDTAFRTIPNLPYSIRKNDLDLAEEIYTLGFPRNVIVYGEGYLSAKSGNDGDSTAYQLTVAVNPGNSGAPVLNKNGEVVGIITSKEKNADGVVYAAKSMNIYKLLETIRKNNDTQNIKLPYNTGLRGLDRSQQVKKMEEYVFMVLGN